MTATETVEALQRQLDVNPADWSLRLVLADALEEAGELDLSYAQRWMAKNQKHPEREPWKKVGGPWVGWTPTPLEDDDTPYALYTALWNAIEGDRWNTRQEAEAALAAALKKLRDLISV